MAAKEVIMNDSIEYEVDKGAMIMKKKESYIS